MVLRPRARFARAWSSATKSTFTAYSTDGYFKPRLILAEEFWVGLIQAAAYLGHESVRITGSKTLSAACLSGMLSANAAHALFSIISQTFTAERRALQRRESDLLHEKTENFVQTTPHPYASLERLFQTTRLIADELFVEVSDKFRNSATLILSEKLI